MTPPATTILEPETRVVDSPRTAPPGTTVSDDSDSAMNSAAVDPEAAHVLALTAQADRVKLRGRIIRG
ncbi:MAG: hypothetical protein VX641_04570 [Planctomycetota bacterium]|nr:hypothetical protein [Planctomycetota bacterium]